MSETKTLYDKLQEQLQAFADSHTAISASEALSRYAYEYAIKAELAGAVGNLNFSPEETEILLQEDGLLDSLYQEWLHNDYSFMDVIEDTVMDFCKENRQELPQAETNKMNVLLVKPNEQAKEAEIGSGLKAMQNIVGGLIEVFRPGKDPVVYILNEEGKMTGLEPNRAIFDRQGNMIDILVGNFFVCGIKDDEFISLSPELMDKYKKLFLEPEIFIRENNTIMSVKTFDAAIKKSLAEQMKEGAEQAAEHNAAHTNPPKKKEQDVSD